MRLRNGILVILLSVGSGCGVSRTGETVFLDYSTRQIDSTLRKQHRREWLRSYKMIGYKSDHDQPVIVDFRIWLPSPIVSLNGLTPMDSTLLTCHIAQSSMVFEAPLNTSWVVELNLKIKQVPENVHFKLETSSGKMTITCVPRPGNTSFSSHKYSNMWKEYSVQEAARLIEIVPDKAKTPSVHFRSSLMKQDASFKPDYVMAFLRNSPDGIQSCMAVVASGPSSPTR